MHTRIDTHAQARPVCLAASKRYDCNVSASSRIDTHAQALPGIGEKKSSAQITVHYAPGDLLGRRVLGVVNFPPRQIGPFMSEALVLGLPDESGNVVLVVPDKDVPVGGRLF